MSIFKKSQEFTKAYPKTSIGTRLAIASGLGYLAYKKHKKEKEKRQKEKQKD